MPRESNGQMSCEKRIKNKDTDNRIWEELESMVELRKGVNMNRKRYGFRVYRKQSTGLRHGNMDAFTRGSTKWKRKNRVRGK